MTAQNQSVFDSLEATVRRVVFDSGRDAELLVLPGANGTGSITMRPASGAGTAEQELIVTVEVQDDVSLLLGAHEIELTSGDLEVGSPYASVDEAVAWITRAVLDGSARFASRVSQPAIRAASPNAEVLVMPAPGGEYLTIVTELTPRRALRSRDIFRASAAYPVRRL